MFSPNIFSEDIIKACDIRGIVEKDFYPAQAYHIGRGFGTILNNKSKISCVVGWDGRHSSPDISAEIISGLQDSGILVYVLGLIPTPLMYFGVTSIPADSGIMITASHNPPEYNGCKFITKEGPFHGKELRQLAEICRTQDYIQTGKGEIYHRDLLPSYMQYLHSFLRFPATGKSLSIVWDPGNGATAAILEPFIKKLPGMHQIICGEVNGDFPNHHPDPSLKENLVMLSNQVVYSGFDLGIAFDGDGDRIGVVDKEGEMLYGDQLLALLARDFLLDNPGERVMSEVKASRFLYDDITKHGGIPVMWKVGHTHQKTKMIEDHILLAGETSGHIFYAENNFYDDALFSAVKLLNLLHRTHEDLSELRKAIPSFYDTGEIRIKTTPRQSQKIIEKIQRRFLSEKREFIDIDGIRALFPDGFWLLRGSNTLPHMTIRVEADTKEGLDRCYSDLQKQLELCGISLPV